MQRLHGMLRRALAAEAERASSTGSSATSRHVLNLRGRSGSVARHCRGGGTGRLRRPVLAERPPLAPPGRPSARRPRSSPTSPAWSTTPVVATAGRGRGASSLPCTSRNRTCTSPCWRRPVPTSGADELHLPHLTGFAGQAPLGRRAHPQSMRSRSPFRGLPCSRRRRTSRKRARGLV